MSDKHDAIRHGVEQNLRDTRDAMNGSRRNPQTAG
jgi:hypothetical protein